MADKSVLESRTVKVVTVKVVTVNGYEDVEALVTKDGLFAIHNNLDKPYLFSVTQIFSGLSLENFRDMWGCLSFIRKVKNLNWNKKYLDDYDMRKYAEVLYKINNSAEKRRCDRVKGKENAIDSGIRSIKDMYKYNKKLIDNI